MTGTARAAFPSDLNLLPLSRLAEAPAPARLGRHSCSASWLTLNNYISEILLYFKIFKDFREFMSFLISSVSEHSSAGVLMYNFIIYMKITDVFLPIKPIIRNPHKTTI